MSDNTFANRMQDLLDEFNIQNFGYIIMDNDPSTKPANEMSIQELRDELVKRECKSSIGGVFTVVGSAKTVLSGLHDCIHNNGDLYDMYTFNDECDHGDCDGVMCGDIKDCDGDSPCDCCGECKTKNDDPDMSKSDPDKIIIDFIIEGLDDISSNLKETGKLNFTKLIKRPNPFISKRMGFGENSIRDVFKDYMATKKRK